MANRLLLSLATVSLISGCVESADEIEGSTESAVNVAEAGGPIQIINQVGECLDVPSFSRASATHLQGSACKRSGYGGNQHFRFEAVTGGYRIRAFDSQLCLDLPSSATTDGTFVQQSQCHTGQNQIWTIQDEPFDYVRLTPALDPTKCLHFDVAHQAKIARCANLPTTATSFGFAAVRTHYSIRANTGQCLDMPSFSLANGASPQLFGCKSSNSTNQEWAFDPVAGGTFRLRGQSSGKCLDLRGGSAVDSTVIEQQPCGTGTNQQWRLAQQTTSEWKLQNVATNKCADFYSGALREYTCSASWPTQLYTFEPGLSGPPLGITGNTPFLPPRTGPQPSYAVDPALTPITLHTTALDNAAVLDWTDPNPRTQGYLVLVWESIAGNPQGIAHEEIPVPLAEHSFWFGRIGNRTLVPGRHYDIEVWAMSATGVQPSVPASRASFNLPLANVRIGTPVGGTTLTPTPTGVFSLFDFDGDGIVNSAPAGAGTFPRFPSNSGASPMSAVGNRYATANGLRANAIVGYALREPSGRETFVAYHFFIDSMTGATRSIAVFYGDLGSAPGTNVWSSSSATVGDIEVTPGITMSHPTVVNGHVTVSALANDNSIRVIDFDFVTALDPG